jgi:hypothetical protein
VQIQERDTRKKRWEQLDDDFSYDPNQLDRDVVAPDQIRTIVRTFRDKLFTEIFPGRTWVPKTLIFAKGEAEKGKRPVDVCPAERAGHGWPALGFRAERDARAKKHAPAASGHISSAIGDYSAKVAIRNGCFRRISSTMSGCYHAITQ